MASSLAFLRRSWRFAPLALFVLVGGYFGLQRLGAPGPNYPLGATAAMAFSQGPTILLSVRSFELGPVITTDPADRRVTFDVSMRLQDKSAVIESGDALASYCSVVDAKGTLYPSYLARSGPGAGHGLFYLQNGEPRVGTVYSAIPRDVAPVGVRCQLGTEWATWTLR